MLECIYDPGVRLAAPDQLRHSACGQRMSPAQADRHALVYRCDPNECGRHTAPVDVVESGLLQEFRGYRVHQCWGRANCEVMDAMYASLTLAWIDNGQVCAGAVRFHEPL
jgi:hypothetical protein